MTATLQIGTVIHASSDWLGPELVSRADVALSAHEERKYTQAVMKAGACLEGLLLYMLRRRDAAVEGQPTLGPLIGALRKTGRVPESLLERLNEANVIRNRAAHDKPLRLSEITEGDSLQILSILGLVVEWCEDELRPEREHSSTEEGLPIFLSVGGPHRLDQEQFIQHVRSEMRHLGVELRSLTSAVYSQDKPFDQICQVMSTCCAALVVGLDRTHAYAVFERERSERQKVYHDQFIPTAWNQIEGAIASTLERPVLVLRERGLHREGIFEAENHRHHIREFDLSVECRGLSPDLREFLTGWVRHVRGSQAVKA